MTVTTDTIRDAARTLQGAVVRTPTVRSGPLSALTGAEVYLKLETLQYTGSFKDRGALVKLASLTAEQAKRGVIAVSAGNHAQGVAYHARRLGIPATIVMPLATPFTKISRTEALGARVLLHGDTVSGCLPLRRRHHAEGEADLRASLRRRSHHRGPGHGRTGDSGGPARLRRA